MIFPKIDILGDKTLCSKYLPMCKNRVEWMFNNLGGYKKQSIILNDNLNGDTYEIVILLSITPISKSGTINSRLLIKKEDLLISDGVSRTEINFDNFPIIDGEENTFLYFYPKGSELGFQPNNNLYVDYKVDNRFQQTYFGKNVNKAHYLYGNQFTGEMKKVVQLMLGSKIKINYNYFYSNTDGIFTDSLNGKWLINISGQGMYCRKIEYTNNIPDGIGIDYINDLKLLNTDFIYNNPLEITKFGLSESFGWAFNSKGDKIQNCCLELQTGDIKYKAKRYEIRITETIINNVVSLGAEYSLIEEEYCPFNKYDTFVTPIFNNSSHTLVPESTNNLFYNTSKKGSLNTISFGTYGSELTDIKNLINDKSYKSPIMVFFDESDNAQVLYYYNKVSNKERFVDSDNINVEEPEDFYKPSSSINNIFNNNIDSYVHRSVLKELGTIVITNDDKISINEELFNTYYTHGFMYGNIYEEIKEDNLGDITTEFSYYEDGENTSILDNFYEEVVHGSDPNGLSSYINFNSVFDINTVNSSVLEFKNKYINSETLFDSTSVRSFNLKLQRDYINKRLEEIDIFTIPLNRLDTVLEINDIDYVNEFDITNENIDFPPYLYLFNNNIKNVFDYFNANMSSLETDIDSSKDLLDDNEDIDLFVFNDLIQYLKSSDPANLDYNYINTLLISYNTQIIDINSKIETINNNTQEFIDFFNSSIITDAYDNYNEYQDTINQYNDFYINSQVEENNVKFDLQNTIITVNSGGITQEDSWNAGTQFAQVNAYKKQTIKNRVVSNFSLILNCQNRSSFNIYNQTKTYGEINYYRESDSELNKLDNLNVHFDSCPTNKCRLFKNSEIRNSGVLVSISQHEPQLSISYDNVSTTVVDYLGNNVNISFDTDVQSDSGEYVIGINYKDITPIFNYGQRVNGDLSISYNYDNFLPSFVEIPFEISVRDVIGNIKENEYLSENTSSFNTYTYRNNIINNSSNYIDDARLVFSDNSYRILDKNFQKVLKSIKYTGDGTIFFNFLQDSFTNNMVISKEITEWYVNPVFLTNVILYPNIIYDSNVYPINFIGNPF